MKKFFLYLVLTSLQCNTILDSVRILTDLLSSQIQGIRFSLFDFFLPALLRYNLHAVNNAFNLHTFITSDL